nr:immunoglobulin heavy chain junction region [Macaca mulatta]MOW90896.1 immunoglobulin heavy chain junction region [Macaca mulatta]
CVRDSTGSLFDFW